MNRPFKMLSVYMSYQNQLGGSLEQFGSQSFHHYWRVDSCAAARFEAPWSPLHSYSECDAHYYSRQEIQRPQDSTFSLLHICFVLLHYWFLYLLFFVVVDYCKFVVKVVQCCDSRRGLLVKEVEVVEFVVVILVETGFELLLFIEPEIVKKSMNGAKKEMLGMKLEMTTYLQAK